MHTAARKLLAEEVHREWQEEEPTRRSLVIVRPTVVFGERNRGNVYELLRQIMTRRFVMVGSGRNRKSMAYVGNVSAFLVHVLGLGAGTHLFNYVDGPDLSMEELVQTILVALGRPRAVEFSNTIPRRLPGRCCLRCGICFHRDATSDQRAPRQKILQHDHVFHEAGDGDGLSSSGWAARGAGEDNHARDQRMAALLEQRRPNDGIVATSRSLPVSASGIAVLANP